MGLNTSDKDHYALDGHRPYAGRLILEHTVPLGIFTPSYAHPHLCSLGRYSPR